MKKLIIPIVLIVLLAVSVFGLSAGGGGIFIREKGNTGLQGTSEPTTDYTAYAINYPSSLTNYTNTSYATCSIGASELAPLSVDFNRDGYGDILTLIGTTAYLYNRDCELMTSFSVALGGSVFGWGMDNPDEDSPMNIYMNNYSHIIEYEYNIDSGEFDYLRVSDKFNIGLATLACPFLSDYCFGDVYSVGGTYSLSKADVSSMLYESNDGAPYVNGAALYSHKRNSLHTFRGTFAGGGYYYRIPALFVHDTNNDIYLTMWDGGAGTDLVTTDVYGMTGTTAEVKYRDAFIGKLGSSTYTFVSFVMESVYDYIGAAIYDTTSLATLYEYKNFTLAGAGVNMISNWVVGDFDQNGENEACYIRGVGFKPSFANRTNAYFTCLDSATGIDTDIDVTAVMDINRFAMADFDGNNSYSEIVTCEGIYRYDGADFTKIFDSGITGNCTGDIEVIRDGSSGVMAALYTSNETGFFIRSTDVGANCGDGVCGLYENPYNCLEDCNITSGESGIGYSNGTAPTGAVVGLGNGVLCASGYLEYGRCSLKPGGRDCTADSECLSGDCDGAICSDAGAWAGIDNYINLSFGSDSTSLTFISVFIIIALTAGIIIVTKGSLAGVIASVGVMMTTMIFFTIVGWLPIFFLFGSIMLIIIGIVMLMMFTNGG